MNSAASCGNDAKHRYVLLFPIILILISFSLVLMSGCVEKRFLPSEREEIERAFGTDPNGDGVFEHFYGFFVPKQVGNITVKREIVSNRDVGNEVTTTIRIISNRTGKVSNVEIREMIPLALSRDLSKVSFDPPYDAVVKNDPPFVVSWKFTFSGDEELEKDITYKAVVYQEINRDWLSNEMTPSIDVEMFDTESIPVVAAVISIFDTYMKTLESVVPNYYIAVAIYFSSVLCVVLVLYETLTVFIAFLSAMVSRRRFKDEVYKFIGHGRKGHTTWLIVGIAFIVAGGIMCAVTSEAEGSAKMEMLERIASNPLMAVGISAILLGVISLYTVVIDLIKGSLFGEKYFFEPMDIARAKVMQARDLLATLQDRVDECSDLGISAETELLFMKTQRRKIEDVQNGLDVENAEEYVPLISRIASDIDTDITEVEEKMALYKNWPEWKVAIDKTLIIKDSVAPEDLISVPEGWRKWALTRYMSEHLGEALTIENGVLTRMRIATVRKGEIELVLNEFMGMGTIEGVALVRKDGLMISSNLPGGIDANVIAAVCAKVIANADMSSMELEKGKTRMIIIKSTAGETIIYGGKKVVLVAIAKAGGETGFVVSGIEKVMEKIETLLG